MTLTIELDDSVTTRLERNATNAHMDLPAYVASVLLQTASDPASPPAKKHRNLGFGEGRGYWMSDDFDAPLEEFKDYM